MFNNTHGMNSNQMNLQVSLSRKEYTKNVYFNALMKCYYTQKKNFDHMLVNVKNLVSMNNLNN